MPHILGGIREFEWGLRLAQMLILYKGKHCINYKMLIKLGMFLDKYDYQYWN